MNILEEKLVSLGTEINTLKASQYLGGSNYRVYSDRASLGTSLNTYQRWWVCFKGNSNFPLVNWGFEVYENGSLKVAKNDWHDSLPGNSTCKYSMHTVWGSEATGVTLPIDVDVYAPNVNTFILEKSDGGSGSGEIIVKVKASCEGIIYFKAI